MVTIVMRVETYHLAGVLSKMDTLINLFLIYGTSSRPSVAHGFQDN